MIVYIIRCHHDTRLTRALEEHFWAPNSIQLMSRFETKSGRDKRQAKRKRRIRPVKGISQEEVIHGDF